MGPGMGPEMSGPYMPGRGPMGMPPGVMANDPRRSASSLTPGYMGQVCGRTVRRVLVNNTKMPSPIMQGWEGCYVSNLSGRFALTSVFGAE